VRLLVWRQHSENPVLVVRPVCADPHPAARTAFKNHLVKQFGLKTQESAVIGAAGQELQALLLQLRPVVRSIVPDASGRLSMAGKATFSALAAR
jgi:hypothetical protein